MLPFLTPRQGRAPIGLSATARPTHPTMSRHGTMADHLPSLATDTGNKGHTGSGNTTARPLHSTPFRFSARMRAQSGIFFAFIPFLWDGKYVFFDARGLFFARQRE